MVESVAETASADPLIEDLVVRTATMSLATTVPSWYKLPLIPLASFISIIKPFYDIREGRHISKSEVDPIFDAICSLTAEEKFLSQKIKTYQMCCGNFHETVVGYLPGMRKFKRGHVTKCDVGTLDCSWVIELKNHVNTMNDGGRKTVESTLKNHVKLGRRATLCIVNATFEKKTLLGGAEEISGRQLYRELTGIPDYFNQLVATVRFIFDTYPTYASLVATVGSAAVEAALEVELAKTPLDELTKTELEKRCKKLSLNKKGSKTELVKRLSETASPASPSPTPV